VHEEGKQRAGDGEMSTGEGEGGEIHRFIPVRMDGE
jgi:hypothetical protein